MYKPTLFLLSLLSMLASCKTIPTNGINATKETTDIIKPEIKVALSTEKLIENELKKARTSALSGDIETAEKIIYWFQKEVLSNYKTETHNRIIEEIHKLLAPYVITEYKKNPEKWSGEGHLKHINTYYAHHFNPINREFYVQNIIKLAVNVIDEFKGYEKKYENKNKFSFNLVKATYLKEVFADFIKVEGERELSVLYKLGQEFHENLASRPDTTELLKLIHLRISWYVFHGDHIELPDYKSFRSNKLNMAVTSNNRDCGSYLTSFGDKLLFENNKDIGIHIKLTKCGKVKLGGFGYRTRDKIKKTKWEKYKEKVPVYSTSTSYETNETSGFIPDMGQTSRCLEIRNNRCVSSYTTATNPGAGISRTFLTPKYETSITGYRTVTKYKPVVYEESVYRYSPFTTTQYNVIRGDVTLKVAGKTYTSSLRYNDISSSASETAVNKQIRVLTKKAGEEVTDFNKQYAYTKQYHKLLIQLEKTKESIKRESIIAEMHFLYALINDKSKLGKIPNDVFKDKYDVAVFLFKALDPKTKEVERHFYIKGTRLLYDGSYKKHKVNFELN